MQYRAVAGMLAIVASLLIACPIASAAACQDADLPAVAALTDLSRIESSVHCLVNAERTAKGLPALGSDEKLAAAARGHSSSMRWNGFFSHTSPDGSSFIDRIAATGYLTGARRWLVGENIAWGTLTLSTPRSLLISWMNSPAHRENILDPDYQEFGVGADWGSPLDPQAGSATIFTTDFGYVRSPRASHKRKKKRRKRKGKPH